MSQNEYGNRSKAIWLVDVHSWKSFISSPTVLLYGYYLLTESSCFWTKLPRRCNTHRRLRLLQFASYAVYDSVVWHDSIFCILGFAGSRSCSSRTWQRSRAVLANFAPMYKRTLLLQLNANKINMLNKIFKKHKILKPVSKLRIYCILAAPNRMFSNILFRLFWQ